MEALANFFLRAVYMNLTKQSDINNASLNNLIRINEYKIKMVIGEISWCRS